MHSSSDVRSRVGNNNEQVALDRKKMTGRTGLPEQVSQDKNAETGCQDGQPGYDSQNSRDERDRQNRTKNGLIKRDRQNQTRRR